LSSPPGPPLASWALDFDFDFDFDFFLLISGKQLPSEKLRGLKRARQDLLVVVAGSFAIG